MSSKGSNSLKELKTLREAVLAEEKARTQAKLQHLPQGLGDIARANEEEIDEEPLPLDEDSLAAEEAPGPSIKALPSPPARSAAKPAGPPAVKSKVNKEQALIIPLTPKIQERLQKNVENARWSPAELVMELIRVSLHRGYPAIQFGDQVVAKSGTYRTFERNPFETTLKIVSGQGVFQVSVHAGSQEYERWLTYFSEQAAADPNKSASQVCLFALQSYLENVDDFRPDGWTKTIPEDNYSLNRVV